MAAAGFAVGSRIGGSSCMPIVTWVAARALSAAISSTRPASSSSLHAYPYSSDRAASAITFAESTMSSITTYSSG